MAARVQHPAPFFKGTAVVDGSFEGQFSQQYIQLSQDHTPERLICGESVTAASSPKGGILTAL